MSENKEAKRKNWVDEWRKAYDSPAGRVLATAIQVVEKEVSERK